MEITPWMIYWVTRFDALKGTLEVFAWVFLCAGVFLGIRAIGFGDEHFKKPAIKWTLIALAIGMLVSFFPKTKEVAAMFVIPQIVNNKEIQEIPSGILSLANEWIEELKPNKTEEK